MLWVDKHRPKSLDSLDVHPELTTRLGAMSEDGEIPHLLFYGPAGSGKKTRVLALLKRIYGPGAERVRLEHRSFKTPSNRVVELTTVASNYHIEMSPGDAGIYDRYVVQDIIKEIAQSRSISASMGGGGSDDKKSKIGHKVVVLVGVDRLTKQAQAGLRRTMERYTSSCRLILLCHSPSKVIEPVRSRCLGVRVPAPSESEVCSVLTSVCRKESLTLPPALAARVAKASKRNLRRAVLMIEACRVQQYPFSEDQEVQMTDWENYITQLAREVVLEQSPRRLLEAREKLYELLTNCIPADVILKTLTRELVKNLDCKLWGEVFKWAAFYEHRLHMGSKEILHLEAFVAKFMSIYKAYIIAEFM
ncbi:unnamed protein product [Ectocarpus sp. CCAP 1310/34]|nr:unnamed protein product [Ectocarpus sp. CCAP 1310/34]